jgi:hypothetical protein
MLTARPLMSQSASFRGLASRGEIMGRRRLCGGTRWLGAESVGFWRTVEQGMHVRTNDWTRVRSNGHLAIKCDH